MVPTGDAFVLKEYSNDRPHHRLHRRQHLVDLDQPPPREGAGALAPEGTTLVEIPIKDLPFYSPDHDADFPQVARDFKQAIEDVDGVIIVTPEYSRSIPGVLKNALDWAARPWGQGSFNGKPTAVIGTSGGGIATAAAQQHLKAILSHYNAPTLGQPEGYVQTHARPVRRRRRGHQRPDRRVPRRLPRGVRRPRRPLRAVPVAA